MDNQLPPVIFGGLLIVPVVTVASSYDTVAALTAVATYLLAGLGLGCFAWGMHVNAQSRKYPESPFNKHISPWVIVLIIVACSAHSAWVAFNGPYAELSYVFLGAIFAAVGFGLRTSVRKPRHTTDRKLP